MRAVVLLLLVALPVFLLVEGGRTDGQPEQIHLSLTGNPSEMVVQWVTWQGIVTFAEIAKNTKQLLLATPAPVVSFAKSGSSTYFSATGNTTTYDESGWPGFIHTVVITDLLPNTAYTYVCGSTGQWSQKMFFHTLPTEYVFTPDKGPS